MLICIVYIPAGTPRYTTSNSLPPVSNVKIYDIQRETTNNLINQFPRLSVVSPYLLKSEMKSEYQCPSKTKPHMEIFDIVNSTVDFYECPDSSKFDVDFILPTMQFFNDLDIGRECPGTDKPEMLAKRRKRYEMRILRIRARKMNRHKLEKFRKRMKYVFRKFKLRKVKRKQEKLKAEIEEMHAAVRSYDPLAVIKEEIALARRGGFRIDLYGTKTTDK